MRHSLIALAAALGICAPAAAANHDTVVPPLGAGPFKVACSNIAQDEALIAALGSTPAEIWEGRPRDGQERYVSQVLAAPDAALRFDAPVPDIRGDYPRFAGDKVPHAAIVCHPTPQSNPDADYVLPGTGDIVPRMQLPGAAPRLIGRAEYAAALGIAGDQAPATPARLPLVLFSHGLGGSPISPGYLDAVVDLASHGFMVAAVFHGDSRFSRIRVEDLGDLVSMLADFDEFVEMELLRPVSLKALVDVLLPHPGFGPGIDPDRIGGFGASMGGQAMANVMGARLTASLRLACRATVSDPRVRAAVGLVPYAGQTFLPAFCDDQSGVDEVDRPYLAIAGTADTTAPITMVEQAINRFRGSRYLVALEGVEHEYLPEFRDDVMTWTVTFLNAYLGVPADPGAMARFIRLQGVAGGPRDALRVDVHMPFPPGPGEAIVQEFRNESTGRYFLTAFPGEIDMVLAGGAGPGWRLTGLAFKAYTRLPEDAFSTVAPVCRYYGGPPGGIDSHFFAATAFECELARRTAGWHNEGTAFYIAPVAGVGRCPAGHLQVLRAYYLGPQGTEAGFRFTTSDSTWREMERAGWTLETAVMCARP